MPQIEMRRIVVILIFPIIPRDRLRTLKSSIGCVVPRLGERVVAGEVVDHLGQLYRV